MLYEIKHRYTGAVLFSLECESFRVCVEAAVKARVDLSGSNLSGSNLRGSDLRYSDLRGSDLSGSNLSGSNLRGSDLRGSDLRGSDLSGSDLRGSYLRYSNLRGSDLSGSNLSGSNLRGSDLSGSNLSGSNLRGSDLSGSNLSGSDLRYSKNADLSIARTRILPQGSLIGWKKLANGTIAKLRIPEEAKRSHAFGRKCRAEFADVLEGEGVSQHDGVTKYAPGLRVTCHKWEENWQQECAGGIHFYITKEEAEAH